MPVVIGGAVQADIYHGTWHSMPNGPRKRMGNSSYCLEHCKKCATQGEAFDHFLQFFPSCNSQANITIRNVNSP